MGAVGADEVVVGGFGVEGDPLYVLRGCEGCCALVEGVAFSCAGGALYNNLMLR